MPPAEIVPSLPRLVATGLIDAQLAALAWLLLEDGVPVLVAVPGNAGDGGALLDGLVAALPADRRPDTTAPGGALAARRVVRVPETLSAATPPGVLRAALAATTGRSGLAAVIDATDLATALAVLRHQGLTDDEISFLGVVLVLAPGGEPPAGAESPARIVAAHYLRPMARDAGGHVQRLGPAVLATWDAARSAYDHFEWGIYPELVARTGRRAGDLEQAQEDRAERLRSAAVHDPI